MTPTSHLNLSCSVLPKNAVPINSAVSLGLHLLTFLSTHTAPSEKSPCSTHVTFVKSCLIFGSEHPANASPSANSNLQLAPLDLSPLASLSETLYPLPVFVPLESHSSQARCMITFMHTMYLIFPRKSNILLP